MYYVNKVNFIRVLMNVLITVLHKVNILMLISSFYSVIVIEITDLNALCHSLPKYKKINFSSFINRRMHGCIVILYKGKYVLCSR